MVDRSGKSILVVEDDPLVREHTVNLIETLGYKVFAAKDGQTALDLLGRNAPIDLLFTDMVMPGGMNGRQLANAAQLKIPQLKVLYTTGYSKDGIVSNGRLDDDVELLMKPYRKAQLIAKLEAVLGL